MADLYAPIGRPSIDPEVFFRFQLIAFFEGIRSERKLVETAALNLVHRWYLGFPLDEPLPDRSSLVKIRQRMGLDIFRRFFEHIVDLCEGAGLIWEREVLVDATKVPGNAAMDSLVPRLKEVIDDDLVELFDDGHESSEDSKGDAEPTAASSEDTPPLLHPDGGAAGLEEGDGGREPFQGPAWHPSRRFQRSSYPHDTIQEGSHVDRPQRCCPTAV